MAAFPAVTLEPLYYRALELKANALENANGSYDASVRLSKELWMWCASQNVLVSGAHISGTQKNKADSFSRNFKEAAEWNLSSTCLKKFHIYLAT